MSLLRYSANATTGDKKAGVRVLTFSAVHILIDDFVAVSAIILLAARHTTTGWAVIMIVGMLGDRSCCQYAGLPFVIYHLFQSHNPTWRRLPPFPLQTWLMWIVAIQVVVYYIKTRTYADMQEPDRARKICRYHCDVSAPQSSSV